MAERPESTVNNDDAAGLFKTPAATVLCGALLGAMLLLSLLDLCAVIEYRASASLVGTLGGKTRAALQAPGVWLAHRRGLTDEQLNWRKDIRTLYVLGALGSLGLLLGAAGGLIVVLPRLGRAAAPGPPSLPALVPLVLAGLGIFYQGYIWSNLAVLLLPRTRRRAWLTAATWAAAFLTVVAWSWALDVDWSEGWSKRYHWARSLFFPVGHEMGAKE